MIAAEFDSYDGLGLADLVRRGDVNAGELLDIAIARVETGNPELNAVVSRRYDQARGPLPPGCRRGRSRACRTSSRTWAPPPARPLLQEVGRDTGRLRIAITTTPWNRQPVDPECVEAAVSAGRLCERLGHHVEEAAPEIDAKLLGEATLVVIGGNVRAALEARAATLGRELTAGDVERITWARAMDGHTTRAADYARSIGVIHRTGRTVARFFTRYDILLSPTMCRPPTRSASST